LPASALDGTKASNGCLEASRAGSDRSICSAETPLGSAT
jgi:hypothetical protein